MKRIAMYARVSTKEGKQHLENQWAEMESYINAQSGWKPIRWYYHDQQSGASDKRPGLERLMADAARKKFDLVLVVDLSRLTRGGPLTALKYIERLQASGVEFWSIKEEMFRTSGPLGAVLVAIVAWVAQQERETISRRVKSGLDRLRKSGHKLGRRPEVADASRALELRRAGTSYRKIAQILGVSKTTIQRTIERHASDTTTSR